MGDVNIKKVEFVIEHMQGELKDLFIKDNRFTSTNGIKAQMLEIRISTA